MRPIANRVDAALLASATASALDVGSPRPSCPTPDCALGVSPKSSSNYNDNTKRTTVPGECSGKDR